MSYTKEEIEKKRQLALQRAQQSQIKKEQNSSIVNRNINSSTLFSHNAKSNDHPSIHIERAPTTLHEKRNNWLLNRRSSSNSSGKQLKLKACADPINSSNFFGIKLQTTGHCYMISDNRFALETSTYFPPIIEVMKTVPSRLYDIQTKTWNFHIKDYENLMEKIIQFKSDVQITGLPKVVLQTFRKALTESENQSTYIDLSNVDPSLTSSLMPFQRDGVCYGISKGGRCMIADDMGLGKTIQALGIAHYFKKDWPLLIVAPSSVKYQWSDAIFKFLPSVPTQYVYHFTNTKDVIDAGKVVIISYDLLVRAVKSFERHTFNVVILDESHVLKSLKTARFKAAQRIASNARRVILLTGTPALSRPIELYSQISLIVPRFMGYQDYGIRYCAGKHTSFGWDFTGSSNTQELQLLLKHCCVIRRLKGEVLSQMPTKKREVIILDEDLIKTSSTEMIAMCKRLQQSRLTQKDKHTALIQYYNESSFAKQKAICEYVGKLFRSKIKCLVYAHHQNILDAISEKANTAKIKFIRIDGRTNPEQRKYLVDKFQKDDDCLAAILSITAANAGITLTAAQLVVFAELFWNPGILCQAEDRVHRIGQDNNVVIQYLVAKQTADDYLWPLIQKKLKVLNMVGLDQDFSLTTENLSNQNTVEKERSILAFLNSSYISEKSNEKAEESSELLDDFSITAEECNELEQLEKEEFDFCNWDDVP